MRQPVLMLVLACAACGANPAGGESPPSSAPSQQAAGDAWVPESIEGHYRVAGVRGEEIDLGWGMSLVIERDRITLGSQCVRPVWEYTYSEGTLATTSVPVAICDRGRYPAEEAVIAAIDGANFVIRTPENATVFQGEGGTLVLYSQ